MGCGGRGCCARRRLLCTLLRLRLLLSSHLSSLSASSIPLSPPALTTHHSVRPSIRFGRGGPGRPVRLPGPRTPHQHTLPDAAGGHHRCALESSSGDALPEAGAGPTHNSVSGSSSVCSFPLRRTLLQLTHGPSLVNVSLFFFLSPPPPSPAAVRHVVAKLKALGVLEEPSEEAPAEGAQTAEGEGGEGAPREGGEAGGATDGLPCLSPPSFALRYGKGVSLFASSDVLLRNTSLRTPVCVQQPQETRPPQRPKKRRLPHQPRGTPQAPSPPRRLPTPPPSAVARRAALLTARTAAPGEIAMRQGKQAGAPTAKQTTAARLSPTPSRRAL